MLTPSDHYISANSAAADQLCDVAVIWAAAICCRLPDFTPYLPTPLVFFFFFFFLWLLHSLIFSRLLSVCFCLLSEDQALNEISDGGWGKPRPEALWAFSAVFFFLIFFSGEVTEWEWHSVSQGGRQKGRTSHLLSAPAALHHATVMVSLWNNGSYRIQFHDTIIIKKQTNKIKASPQPSWTQLMPSFTSSANDTAYTDLCLHE